MNNELESLRAEVTNLKAEMTKDRAADSIQQRQLDLLYKNMKGLSVVIEKFRVSLTALQDAVELLGNAGGTRRN